MRRANSQSSGLFISVNLCVMDAWEVKGTTVYVSMYVSSAKRVKTRLAHAQIACVTRARSSARGAHFTAATAFPFCFFSLIISK